VNRKLKKYNLQYEYLKLDEEDVREELGQYIKDFENTFSKYYNTKPPGNSGSSDREVWVNEETGEVREEPPPLDDIFENYKRAQEEHERGEREREERLKELKNRPEKIKKLYKKLAIKAHPDRGGSDELFQEVNDAYTQNNLMWLLTKAGEYEIEYEVDSSDEKVLRKNLEELKNEINRMRDTTAWTWGTGGVEERKYVVKRVEKETGWKIPSEDLPDDLKPKKKEELLLKDKKLLDNKK